MSVGGRLRIRAALVSVGTVSAVVMSVLSPPAASADGAGSVAVTGEMIPAGVFVNSSGQPTTNGGGCVASLISGCLVVGTPSASNMPPIVVSDGFELQTPVPKAWAPLELSAEATVANLRGVPADRRNQNWARPEINTLMFLRLVGLIHADHDGESLTAEEEAQLAELSASFQDFEKRVADRALDLYATWASDPCHFDVPVGDDPGAYTRMLGTTCASPIGGLVSGMPVPQAEQFTEWARELVGDDMRRALAPQVKRFSQVQGTGPMTTDEAGAEVALEYQSLIGSMEKGYSYLAAAQKVASEAPGDEQPQATGELLDAIKEAAGEFGTDRFIDMSADMIEASVKLLGPVRSGFFGVEQQAAASLQGVSSAADIGYDVPIGPYTQAQQALVDLITEEVESAEFTELLLDTLAEGLMIGGIVLGAAAVITAEAIQVDQDISVLPTLQANRTKAYATPDLEAQTQSAQGWAKLENAFVQDLLPDFTFRKLRDPAPAGAPPARTADDPSFNIHLDGTTQETSSPSILVEDWARPGMPQAISVSNGWVTRQPLLAVASDNVPLVPGAPTPGKDLLGAARSDTSFNYVDPNGDWWRAWPSRGSLMQVRFAKQVTGVVDVYRYLTEGLPSQIPCHNSPFATEIEPKDNGFRCVVGSGTHFKSELAKGDFVVLGDEVKKVETVFSDTAFTTTTPFKSDAGAFEPIDTSSRLMKMVGADANCWTDGNCRNSESIDYVSRHGNVLGHYTATMGDRPPVIAPSITGTLHSGAVQLGQTCDPRGNCSTTAAPTWTFAPGEALRLDTHAYDPDPGDKVRLINWQFCDPDNLCDIFVTVGGGAGNGFTETFDHPGTWTVRIFALDQSDKRTEVTTTIRIQKADQAITDAAVPDAPRYGQRTTITPIASSGLAVEVSSQTPSVCTTSGDHGHDLTFTGVGTCILEEAQPGNTTFNAATEVRPQLSVGRARATVVSLPSVQYSDPLPNLNVATRVEGLIGSDTLTGTLTGCTAPTLTTSNGDVTSGSFAYPLHDCTGLSNPKYDVDYDGFVRVTPEDATITSTSSELVSTSSASATTAPVTLSASVAQAADGHPGDLTKAHLDFLLWSSGNTTSTPSYTVQDVAPNAAGLASTVLTLPADAYRVVVRLRFTSFFTAPAAMQDIMVVQPVAGLRANGGGWVTDPTSGGNHKGHFAFNVGGAKNGAPAGAVAYTWLNPADGYSYSAVCSTWVSGGLQFSGTGVSASCAGSLSAVDLSTGLPVAGIGGTGYSIVLGATDGGNGGKSDKISFVVKAPNGTVVHSLAGTGGAQVLIGGGNINYQQK
jgi:hypothetical protein